MAMYEFHATLHARPAEVQAGPTAQLKKLDFRTLEVPQSLLAAAAMPCSFEQAAAALGRLEQMYCEPDGSFVWTSVHGHGVQNYVPWQVDGNLYDRNGRVLLVDLKGRCPPTEFDRLLAVFGWPEVRLMFQLVRQAVFLDEPEFRCYAEA